MLVSRASACVYMRMFVYVRRIYEQDFELNNTLIIVIITARVLPRYDEYIFHRPSGNRSE